MISAANAPTIQEADGTPWEGGPGQNSLEAKPRKAEPRWERLPGEAWKRRLSFRFDSCNGLEINLNTLMKCIDVYLHIGVITRLWFSMIPQDYNLTFPAPSGKGEKRMNCSVARSDGRGHVRDPLPRRMDTRTWRSHGRCWGKQGKKHGNGTYMDFAGIRWVLYRSYSYLKKTVGVLKTQTSWSSKWSNFQ